MRPSNLQTIITKNAGFAIPDALFEAILKHKPTAFGFVVQTKDEGLAIEREDGEGLTLDQLKEFNRHAFDHQAMMYFGELSKGYNVEDIQPFTLHDGEDKPFLAIGVEGDFPKFSENNGRTDEANLVSKILVPTLLDICETLDGDLAKIMMKIAKPLFNDLFLAQTGHRGSLIIVPHEGDIVSLGKNELGETYDWGSTTQKHGFDDVAQEPVKEPETKRSRFWSKAVAGASAAMTITDHPKTETDKNGIHTVKDAATPGTASRASVPEVKETDKPVVVRPPNWCHKNEDRKAWYLLVAGSVPQNWKKNIPVTVTLANLPKSLEEMKAMQAEKLKADLKEVKANPTSTATLPAPKSGADIKAAKVEIGKAEENLPIMDAKETERALDFVAKHLDGQSNQMPNPLEIQKMESKWPTLSDTLGIKPHEMLNWPVSGLFALAKEHPKALALAMIEMRALWRSTLKAEDLVNTAKPATTVTKSGDSTVKTESVAPPKAKFFSKRVA